MADHGSAGPRQADPGEAAGRVADELRAAVQDIQQGNLAGALSAAETALALAPANPDCHLVLATVHQNAGRHREAEHHYVQCLRLNARSARALMNLGLLKLNARRGEEAVRVLEAAVALDAASVEARHYLARAYGMTGRTEDAIGQFETLLGHAAQDVQILLGYAKALMATDRGPDAERALKRADALNPGDPVIAKALEAVRRRESDRAAEPQ